MSKKLKNFTKAKPAKPAKDPSAGSAGAVLPVEPEKSKAPTPKKELPAVEQKAIATIAKPRSEALLKEDERFKGQMTRLERGLKSTTYKGNEDGSFSLVTKESFGNHLDLIESTASGSTKFHDIVVRQLVNLDGRNPVATLNAGMAFLRGLEPKDEIEALLISQMFATNFMAMDFAARAIKMDIPELVELNSNRFCRLTKRFMEQMDTLNKYRGKGQQTVTVEHVTVNEGGKAIVGTIATPGGSSGKA